MTLADSQRLREGARDELAEQQAALRRVATLVARGGSARDVFVAVGREAGTLLGADGARVVRYVDDEVDQLDGWSAPGCGPLPAGRMKRVDASVTGEVFRTGRPARIDDHPDRAGPLPPDVRELGIRSAVGAPIMVDGRLWGAVVAWVTRAARLPETAEARLADFTGLVAAAVSSSTSRAELDRLLAEQAALRRVATLVARETPPDAVFAAVAREVGEVLAVDATHLGRFDPDGTVVSVGQWGRYAGVPIGARFPLEGDSVSARVLRTGRPARMDGYDHAPGDIAATVRGIGIRFTVGVPISLEGRPWGVMILSSKGPVPFAGETESRLQDFTELVAIAISNASAHAKVGVLADEQAALRRVATLVARGAPPAEVFDAVVGELGRLLDVGSTGLVRFEDDETATVVAGWGRLGEVAPVGARLPLGGRNVVSLIARTGKPARLDDFARAASGPIAEHANRLATGASVGGPIVVAGRLWGGMIAAALDGGSLPPDVEPRLEQFTDLIGAAIANTAARVELARLADEQAALRRVATLVAEESPAAELFAKVAEEAANVLGQRIDSAILRYEPDDTATVVAVWGEQPSGGIRVGARMPVDGSGVSARVFRERRPVRVDNYAAAGGAIADHARTHGIRSAVGCPILVQGRLWGAMVVAHYEPEPFPPGTERRVSQFTALVSTAIVNAETRAERQRLADEQAALRRVATLVAEAAAPTEVFDAVIVEVAHILGAAQVGMMRAEGADEITIVAQRGQNPVLVQVGMRLPLDGDSVTARVLRTGRSARLNVYDEPDGPIAEIARRSNVNATVGAPIMVEGRLWGVITASWEGTELPPADAEERLTEFAELLDTAIANAHSHDELTASRARVLSAGDEARRRVVRDLHDGAQQRLVHTIVTLKLAQRALGEDGERVAELLAQALDHAEQGNAELRELAHGILPAVLARGGLRDGVDSLVARLDLPVHVDVPRMRLPPEIAASAYFIVAEALTNVAKHAQATTVDVTATAQDGTLRLEVRDDGIGGADPEGHGLLGLGDRAAALGGRLQIDSPRGEGTVVAAELPLPD